MTGANSVEEIDRRAIEGLGLCYWPGPDGKAKMVLHDLCSCLAAFDVMSGAAIWIKSPQPCFIFADRPFLVCCISGSLTHHQLWDGIRAAPYDGSLLKSVSDFLSGLAPHSQHQEAGFARPMVGGVLADAVDEDQVAGFQLCAQPGVAVGIDQLVGGL